MRRSPRQQITFILSIAFAAAPFGFALIRALSSRGDLRMLWMAIASGVGAVAATAIMKARGRGVASPLTMAIPLFIVGTLFAAGTAIVLGTKSGFGVWAVAIVLSGCWAASAAFAAMARQEKTTRADGG